MKITDKLLSIPPYISTPWNTIASLQSRANGTSYTLLVTLKIGSQIEVPGLDFAALNQIFEAHTRYTETEENSLLSNPLTFKLPANLDSTFTNSMQHNSEQSNLPDLPPQVLDRMVSLAKAFGLEDASTLPAPEPDCNCIHCQVLRALTKAPAEEDLVTEADLQFRDWEIKQTAEKLYSVTNPLDPAEHYNVFLGTPVGCTCGQKKCEHIKAVLTS